MPARCCAPASASPTSRAHARPATSILNVPFVISQNAAHETNPLDFSRVRTIADPFPPIVPVKPTTTAELIAANPRCPGTATRTKRRASSGTSASSGSSFGRCSSSSSMSAADRNTSPSATTRTKCSPDRAQDSRRLLQPIASVNNMLQCDPRKRRSTYHAGTLRLQQRFTNGAQFLVSYTYGKSLDYGPSAASGGGAVGNGQTITNMDAWHGPSGFDVAIARPSATCTSCRSAAAGAG